MASQIQQQKQQQLPFLQNGASTMLIPDIVATSSETTLSSQTNNQALTQTLREFEGDNNDPFEMVQLQSIDDIAELQSVLQPNSAVVPTTTSQPYPPVTTVSIVSHDAPLVDLSDSHSEVIPVSTHSLMYNHLLLFNPYYYFQH